MKIGAESKNENRIKERIEWLAKTKEKMAEEK